MKKNVRILNHWSGLTFFDNGGRHYNFAKYLKPAGYEPVVFCFGQANAKQIGSYDEGVLMMKYNEVMIKKENE